MVPLMNPPGATLLDASRIWEPYVEAVLARQRQGQDTPVPVATSERKTGFESAIRALRTLRVSSGGLDLLRRAA